MAKRYKFEPDYVIPPGETLKETLECLNLTQADFARRTGRPTKTISEIINGKAQITPETALQFEKVLGVPASFWNNLERNYREKLAEIEERNRLETQIEWLKKVPVKEMISHGWIKKCSDKISQLVEVLNFYGVASIDAWKDTWSGVLTEQEVAFRKSARYESAPESVSAWLRKGQLDAQNMKCEPYDSRSFRKALDGIRALTNEDPSIFVPKMQSLCADAGVAVVFVKEVPKCPVNGATMWISPDKAMIQLSLRYKTDDHLWFTFFHEAGHILLHAKKTVFLEYKNNKDKREEEANDFAADFLVPQKKYAEFVKTNVLSKETIRSFADQMDIAPGILVGRLQHDNHLTFAQCNDLKRKFVWA